MKLRMEPSRAKQICGFMPADRIHLALNNGQAMRETPRFPLSQSEEPEPPCMAVTDGRGLVFLKDLEIEFEEGDEDKETVSGELLERIARMKGRDIPIDASINGKQRIETSEEEIILKNNEFGTYPDVVRVVPKPEAGNVIKVSIRPTLLEQIAKAMGSSESGVTLYIDTKAINKEGYYENGILVELNGGTNWGVIMPQIKR